MKSLSRTQVLEICCQAMDILGAEEDRPSLDDMGPEILALVSVAFEAGAEYQKEKDAILVASSINSLFAMPLAAAIRGN